MLKFLVIFEKSSNGWGAYVPELPGCVAGGETKEEVESLIYEAIEFHLEDIINNGHEIPNSVIEAETMVFRDNLNYTSTNQ